LASTLVMLALSALACTGPPSGSALSPATSPQPGTVGQSKPGPPVQLALAFRPERPRRGEEVDLELTVRALAALSRVRVVLRVPPEVRLVDGPQVWEGPLAIGERALAFRVVLGGPGRFTVGASAEVLEGPYAGQIAGAVLFVDATAEEVRWSPDPL